jgi:hypothetical protein
MVNDRGVLFKRMMKKIDQLEPVTGMLVADYQQQKDKSYKVYGWTPVLEEDPADQWHCEGWSNFQQEWGGPPSPGTYELCGPKVQGNPEGFDKHVLVPHGICRIDGNPRYHADLKNFFKLANIEGIVWWEAAAGRLIRPLAKIKASDFGVERWAK